MSVQARRNKGSAHAPLFARAGTTVEMPKLFRPLLPACFLWKAASQAIPPIFYSPMFSFMIPQATAPPEFFLVFLFFFFLLLLGLDDEDTLEEAGEARLVILNY